MADTTRRRISVDVSWRTLFKLIAVVALVWMGLQVVQLVLLLVVAVLLAVALDPVVRWVETRGLPRWGAATMVCCALLVLMVGFFVLTWSSLTAQASFVGKHLSEWEKWAASHVPEWAQGMFGGRGGAGGIQESIALYLFRFVQSLGNAIVVFVLAFVITLYLLIEGRRTYAWLVAYVPKSRRPKVEETARAAERVVAGYVAGNIATSIFATVFVLIALSTLRVPAALLLAVLAGICDVIPVIGFVLSALPAVLLALTVSSGTALAVAACYVTYHAIENYVIVPRVYGDRLEMSNLAVILAFVIGAELAGVLGALIALPIAASYPAIERIWLRDRVGEDVLREHRAIETRKIS